MRFIQILLGFLVVLLISSCYGQTIEKCPIKGLLLDKSALPIGAVEEEIQSPMPDAPIISAGRSIYLKTLAIYHEVFQYPPGPYSMRRYEEDRKDLFPVDQNFGPWVKPGFDFSSNKANDFYYACGKVGEKKQCQMIARYNDYFTFVRMQTGNELTENDFELILMTIDQKMSECVVRTSN